MYNLLEKSLIYCISCLCSYTLLLYLEVCLSHSNTVVIDTELVPSERGVTFDYTLHTKGLFSAFHHKVQINDLS